MTTDESYRSFVMEQLESVLPAIHARNMFGGVGIYSHGIFFALIAGDTLYFYADEKSRADYNQFDGQRFGKNYFEVPIGVLEDIETLREWAQKALTASEKKRRPAPSRR
jgi:DNA transformation protein and related proteins